MCCPQQDSGLPARFPTMRQKATTQLEKKYKELFKEKNECTEKAFPLPYRTYQRT